MALAWWTLRWAGVPRVLLLDGGLSAWETAGLALSERAVELPRGGNVQLSPGHRPVLSAGGASSLARRTLLIDTRIRSNYIGGPGAPGEMRRGHIPGAVSVPAPANLAADGRFLAASALEELYGAAGLLRQLEVDIYCGAGVSAAHAIAALATLGIIAPLYVGSWSAYSADPARPAATGELPG